MAFLNWNEPSSTDSSIIIDSILTYYTNASDSNTDSLKNDSPIEMNDPVSFRDCLDFPLPLDFPSQPTDWSTAGILNEALQSPPTIRNVVGHKDSTPKQPSKSHCRNSQRDDFFFQPPTLSSDSKRRDLEDTSQRSRLVPKHNYKHPAFEASKRLNLFLEQQAIKNTLPSDLDIIDRYLALDRGGKPLAAEAPTNDPRSSHRPRAEYQRRPHPPAQKGTFAAPFAPNQRLAIQGSTLPDAKRSPVTSKSASSLFKDLVPISSPETMEHTMSTAASRRSTSYANSNQSESRRSSRHLSKPNRKSAHSQYHTKSCLTRAQPSSIAAGYSQYHRHRHAPSVLSQDRSDSSFPTMHSPELLSSPPPLSPDFNGEEFSLIVAGQHTYNNSMQASKKNHVNSHNFEPRADSPILPSPQYEIQTRKSRVGSPKSLKARATVRVPTDIQTSLIEQGNVAQIRRSSSGKGSVSRRSIKERRASPKLHSNSFHIDRERFAERHANVQLVSPKPERVPSVRSSEEGLQRLLSFEKYLEEQITFKKFDLTLGAGSQPSMSSVSRGYAVPSEPRDEFQIISSTPRKASIDQAVKENISWPLPPYPVDQNSGQKRLQPTHSQSSLEKLSAIKESYLSGESLQGKEDPPPLDPAIYELSADESTDDRRFMKSCYAPHESSNVSISDSIRDPRKSKSRSISRQPVIGADDMKKLPKLPDELDTSAIASFPLSREVPLPEFAAITIPPSAHLRRTTEAAASHQSPDELVRQLVPDFAPVRPVPLWIKDPFTMTNDERDLSAVLAHKESTEQSITDAFVLHLEDCEDRRRRRAPRRIKPFQTRRRADVNEGKGEIESAPVSKKPLRGCCSGWHWFRQRFLEGGISELPSGGASVASS